MKKYLQRILLGLIVFTMGLVALFSYTGKPWTMMCPGIQVNDLDTLDEGFHRKISTIIRTLEGEGFEFSISSTYRSPEKQQCYYDISKVIKKYTGQNGLTTTTKSCHNNTVDGTPSALAIDLHYFTGSMDNKVKFYKRLRTLVRNAGLTSGGDFSKSNLVWAKYDLGWDPGHVQVKGCSKMVQLR